MSEVSFEKIGETKVTRRQFGKIVGAAAVALGATAFFGSKINQLKNVLESSIDTSYNKSLSLDKDGNLTVNEQATPEEIKFTALADSTSKMWNKDNIILRQGEPSNKALEYSIPSEKIKARYGIRKAGQTFNGKFGEKEINYKGNISRNGLWFMLTDDQGRPTDEHGNIINKPEKILYTSANFVTVIPQKPPQK